MQCRRSAERFLIVSSFADELRDLGPANFLYSDGDMLFAHGHRRKHAETGRVERQVSCCSSDIVRAASEASWRRAFDPRRRSAGYAIRERSLDDERWEPLAEGELVAVSRGQFAARQWSRKFPIYEQPVDPLDQAGSDNLLEELS